MKKIILLLLLPVCSWAQFAKGNVFIGGSFSFSNQNFSNASINRQSLAQSFSLSPSFGVFINEKFAGGIRLGYARSSAEIAGAIAQSNNYYAGIFARRYFTLSEKFLFAIDGGINYTKYDTQTPVSLPIYGNNSTLYTRTEGNSLGMAVIPTFIFLPSTHWGIEATLGSLSFYHNDYTSANYTSNVFNMNYGSFSFGFTYYFR